MRARGGRYLENFIEEGFISLGFNKVTMASLNDPSNVESTTGVPDVRQVMANAYPNDTKFAITLHSNQVRLFVYEFNIGDVVIVPGRNSDIFAIGVINGEAYDEPSEPLNKRIDNRISDGINYRLTSDIKRRSVCWIKTITRSELPKNLLFALNAQQTILKIDEGHSSINKLISPLFSDDTGINLVISTNANHGLTTQQLYALSELAELAAEQSPENLHVDTEKNSPITLTFIVQALQDGTLQHVWQMISPYVTGGSVGGATWFTIHKILKVLGGKRIKEVGLAQWAQERIAQHYDNKIKQFNMKQQMGELPSKLSDRAKDGIASLDPKLKTSGTEILPHSQTNSDEGQNGLKKKKHKKAKTGRSKKKGHSQSPEEKK